MLNGTYAYNHILIKSILVITLKLFTLKTFHHFHHLITIYYTDSGIFFNLIKLHTYLHWL